MRYTQSQIRELLSISVDAFRTWRDAIPALALHKGHAPSFTPGDVVAMAIVAELVRDFGVRVGTVGDRFDELFKECRGRSWLSLENCVALIDAESFRLVDVNLAGQRSPDAPTLYIPCAPIIARLRSVLTATEVDQVQGHLQFPPTSVAMRPERRGTRA
ncbi:hypothetical protein FJ434_28520 [Mesorhizobium sp. B2-5-13]|uniref:hypothetical protein n=1 Tax=unclassified Mesorhizobium TaxID=325217 RepID=UPI001129EAB3|nr:MULTISPECIES: hypothetical protein [unclassified Mesorhizobium]TPJ34773.1 hypothetical protein FJ432_29285 [Mesorhizobium sp. B2-6-5]TPJ74572.1 hypothetical protein FJ434_28520 [Mesorhizobium sp. B2-5-13]TPK40330.1 hypothetical protein FJ560_28400 [Mesorhizobium sp. B2-5-5]